MNYQVHANGHLQKTTILHGIGTNPRKILLVMKLALLLILVFTLHANADVFAQRIDIRVNNQPLDVVFKQIRQQSDYSFVFKASYLQHALPVTATIHGKEINEVLPIIFEGQPFDYEIKGKVITLLPKQQTATQQQHTVRGKVTDSVGNPLAGVIVQIKETAKQTTSNKDGFYELNGTLPTQTIQFRLLSYEPYETLANLNVINVVLKLKYSRLDEPVVIAYGQSSRRELLGNVSKITSKEIQNNPIANPLLALQGRTSGVYLTQASGMPGSDVTVRIQGTNSIQNGNDPFYVIDGVPYNGQMLPGLAPIHPSSGSPFSFINPSAIESIEILKDAEATAIYGSRAANGAILITTRKGIAGTTKVDVNVQSGWSTVPRFLDVLNTSQYLEIRNEAKKNDNMAIGLDDFDINGTWSPNRNTDWQQELLGGTGKFQNIQTNLSGGNDHTNFLVGAGLIRETTIYNRYANGMGDTKGSMNFNINHHSPNRKFQFQLTGNYLNGNNTLPYIDLANHAVSLAPNAPALYDNLGNINWELQPNGLSTFDNPLKNFQTIYTNQTQNLIANSIIQYELFNGLQIRSSFGFNNLSSNETSIIPLDYWRPDDPSKTRSARYSDKSIKTWIIEPQIEYIKTFPFGKINALVGSTFQENKSDLTAIEGRGYDSDITLKDINAAANISITNSMQSKYRYSAIFGRAGYSYHDKYYLNVNVRKDGSSRFGSENMFHTFYSIGGAWIFSNENFLQPISSILNFGKIRVNYGTTGNDQIGDYRFLSLYAPLTTPVPYQGAKGTNPIGLANPNLQWEQNNKINIGIDLGFLDNRISLTTNYYLNRSSNQLLSYSLPFTTGFPNILRNQPAVVQNSGLELEIYATPILSQSQFSWSSSFNITIPRNQLIRFPDIERNPSSANALQVGAPITIIKAYAFHGVNSETGIYEFLNKEGEITSTPNSTTDRYKIIDLSPQLFGGWNNEISYGDFSLSILIQFVRQTKQATFSQFGNAIAGSNVNQPLAILNRWQQPGNNSSIQKLNSTGSLFYPNSLAVSSDKAFEDASFLRLKNLSFSYNIPKDISSRLRIQQLSVFAHTQNLFTLTRYSGGYDPENGGTAVTPPLKTVSLGVQLSL